MKLITTSTPFDEKAADWDANPARVALAKAVVESIREAVPLRTDMAAMDFGAGTGLVSLGLLPEVGEFTDSASREAYRITRPGADGVLRTYPVFLVTAREGCNYL